MSERVEALFLEIQQLTVDELNELRAALRRLWDDDGGAGVREPVPVAPNAPSDHALPDDYWETAQ